MMSGGVIETRIAQSQSALLKYTVNTNISIAEPAHIIQKALKEFIKRQNRNTDVLPTLAELRARYKKPNRSEELSWESLIERKPAQ
jgi:hypothetical protein